MTAPAPEPITSVERVRRMLPALTDADEPLLADVVAAVCARITWLAPGPDGAWNPGHIHGATMLAARLWRRRHSPAGVEAFAGDAAVYVSRTDPDVALLLGMGAYAAPVVG